MVAIAPSDETLDRALDGDPSAFAALYRAHAQAIYQLLTRLVGPVAERDDLLQETFVRFHRALPRFERKSSITTFLHRIAVRTAIDHLRAVRRRPVLVDDAPDLADLGELGIAPGASPADHAEIADVLRALGTLSPEQRVAFVLREVLELSFVEIGQLVGCMTTTARMRVAAAARALAKARQR